MSEPHIEPQIEPQIEPRSTPELTLYVGGVCTVKLTTATEPVETPPLVEADVAVIAQRVKRTTAAAERQKAAARRQAGVEAVQVQLSDDLTDRGNARRLLERMIGRVCVVRETGEVLVRPLAPEPAVWVADRSGIEGGLRETAYQTDPQMAAKHPKWAAQSANARSVEAAVRVLPDIVGKEHRASMNDFDKEPLLLALQNGVLDLRTTTLVPYDNSHRFRRCASVGFDAVATCHEWTQYVQDMCALADGTRDRELERYLQMYVGYVLTGLTTEQSMLVFIGEGSNGKGVLDRAIKFILGPLAFGAPMTLLNEGGQKKAEDASPAMARLHSTRYVSISETEKNGLMSAPLMKSLTGGDSITARLLNENAITFDPTHKLTLFTNHPPRFGTIDAAAMSRVKILRFERNFGGAGDGQLAARSFANERAMLENEAPGILRWAADGARAWWEASEISQRAGQKARRGNIGLPACSRVDVATAEYTQGANTVASALTELIMFGEDYKVDCAALYYAYSGWCKARAITPLNRNAFARDVTNSGRLPKPHSNADSPTRYRGMLTREGVALAETAGQADEIAETRRTGVPTGRGFAVKLQSQMPAAKPGSLPSL